jgi:hypothetical protein
MRCYNAAMTKPFQFSMRRLFLAVTILSVTAWLSVSFWRHRLEIGVRPGLIYYSIGATAGAGFGMLTGRPLRFAILGVILAVLIVGLF